MIADLAEKWPKPSNNPANRKDWRGSPEKEKHEIFILRGMKSEIQNSVSIDLPKRIDTLCCGRNQAGDNQWPENEPHILP